MNLDEKIEHLKTGYVAGKNAFTKDEDRSAEFDEIMTETVANIRSDAYTAFRAMMESELDEAIRHVRELTWNECCEAVAGQGTVQLPDNPYTNESGAWEQHEGLRND